MKTGITGHCEGFRSGPSDKVESREGPTYFRGVGGTVGDTFTDASVSFEKTEQQLPNHPS